MEGDAIALRCRAIARALHFMWGSHQAGTASENLAAEASKTTNAPDGLGT